MSKYSKLIAAVAVFALAFAVLAVVPAAADESDAAASDVKETITYSSGSLSEGAYLSTQGIIIAGNVTINGAVSVAGSITINSGATLTISSGYTLAITGDLINNGTIVVYGTLTTYYKEESSEAVTTGTVTNNGIINVASTGTLTSNASTFTNASGASISVSGTLDATTPVTNKGTIALNGTASGDITSSGTITIAGKITATDLEITLSDSASVAITSLTATEAADDLIISDAEGNSVTIALDDKAGVLYGMTVTHVKTTSGNETIDYLDISGTITMGSSNTATISTTGDVAVTGTASTGTGIEVAPGETAEDDSFSVTGQLTTYVVIEDTDCLNAAYYSTGANVNIYTSFASAISAAPSNITIYGTVEISSDVTIPSGTIVANTGEIIIDKAATLTVSGTLTNTGSIDVNGVLVSPRSIDEGTGFTYEVLTQVGTTSFTYSNIVYAINNTTTGNIDLHDDATIDEAVVVAENVVIRPGTHTLTISAAVNLAGSIYLTNEDTLKVTSNKGSIDLGGSIYAPTSTYEDVATFSAAIKIDGAYYTASSNVYVIPVDNALADITTITPVTIYVFSTSYSLGDIAVTGTSSTPVELTIAGNTGTTITAGTITLTYATLDIASGTVITGTIVNSSSDSVALTSVTSGLFTVEEDNGDMAISGIISAGTVTIGGTVDANETGIEIYNLLVNGTLAVGTGATDMEATTATILGTLTIASTGSLTVDSLLVGYNNGAVSSAATVTATGSLSVNTYAIVGAASASTAPSEYGTLTGVTYYVDGAAYATLYGADTQTIATVVYNNTSGAFAGWYNSTYTTYYSGTSSNTISAVTADTSGKKNVYAYVIEDAYKIVIRAVTGVTNVYINGDLMNYGYVTDDTGTYYAYSYIVSAGTYTISYDIASGYTDTNSSKTFTVTASGAVTDISYSSTGVPTVNYELVYGQISGIEVSTDTGSNDDNKMGLTDYLLIILVVLIAVMAIVIAARLLRS
ncbi:MAG: hypothetical protein Q4Q62_06170 [Thermoplasmata archaeon]|nr:hypothetical protein [Thermoplasmata archaeon]